MGWSSTYQEDNSYTQINHSLFHWIFSLPNTTHRKETCLSQASEQTIVFIFPNVTTTGQNKTIAVWPKVAKIWRHQNILKYGIIIIMIVINISSLHYVDSIVSPFKRIKRLSELKKLSKFHRDKYYQRCSTHHPDPQSPPLEFCTVFQSCGVSSSHWWIPKR